MRPRRKTGWIPSKPPGGKAPLFAVIHFDTSFLIAASVAGSPAHLQIQTWVASGETFGISVVAWTEFLCGPLDAQAEDLARNMFPQPEPFLPQDATVAAHLFNQSGRRSRSLADCMIAAIAIRCGAKVATANLNDFQPLVKLGLALA
jgi:predicted nucleic acid-binding protein